MFSSVSSCCIFNLCCTNNNVVATLLWKSGRMILTLSKWGLGSPPGLPKLQSSTLVVKTRCIEAFFISLESYQSVDVEKWARMNHLDSCNTSYAKKKGREWNWQLDSRPLKVRNRPNPGVCRWSATHRWKALNKSYKFALDLIPIGGLNKELWPHKVAGVQTGTVSGLLFGSPEIKSNSDVGAIERHREYYIKEGVGFFQIWAMVSVVSLESPVVCPSTKGALKVN